jgi:hypothetical protein
MSNLFGDPDFRRSSFWDVDRSMMWWSIGIIIFILSIIGLSIFFYLRSI